MKYLAILGIALGILLVVCAGLCFMTLSLVSGDEETPSASNQISVTLLPPVNGELGR